MNSFEQKPGAESVPDIEEPGSFYTPEEREKAIADYRKVQLEAMAAETTDDKLEAGKKVEEAQSVLKELGINPDEVGLKIH